MFKQYLISALRTLQKDKVVTLISAAGLATGLMAFLFTGHYLLFELSYDRFFPDSGQVYRVNLTIRRGSQTVYHGTKTPRNLFFALRREILWTPCGKSRQRQLKREVNDKSRCGGLRQNVHPRKNLGEGEAAGAALRRRGGSRKL